MTSPSEFMEYRVRSKRSDEWVARFKGSMVQPDMVNLRLQGPAKVLKPDGKPLCIYLPGAVADLSETMWEDFSSIRRRTVNRGLASGGDRVQRPINVMEDGTARAGARTTAPAVTSAILGAIDMDRTGLSEPVCRLTAFSAQQVEKWSNLAPMFQRIAQHFEAEVPDRFEAQMYQARQTQEDWVIPGTPFTTITVNNTYPTGIHTDKGDLDAGFSTLAVMRRGDFSGGWLTMPQYGVAVDMQDGDLLLMDAHEWHGNTPLTCNGCGVALRLYDHKCDGLEVSPERVSIVCYYRTKIVQCGTQDQEELKRASIRDERNVRVLGLEYGEV